MNTRLFFFFFEETLAYFEIKFGVYPSFNQKRNVGQIMEFWIFTFEKISKCNFFFKLIVMQRALPKYIKKDEHTKRGELGQDLFKNMIT